MRTPWSILSIRLPLLALVLFLCSGCASILARDRTPVVAYVLLHNPASNTPADLGFSPDSASEPQTTRPSLFIAPVRSSGLDGSSRILFSSDGVTRGSYQLGRWSEPLAGRLQTLLLLTLEDSGMFTHVTTGGALTKPQYVLQAEILDAYHLTQTLPGSVILNVRFELIALQNGEIRGSTRVEISEPVLSADARGAVNAFQVASERLLLDASNWTSSQLKRS